MEGMKRKQKNETKDGHCLKQESGSTGQKLFRLQKKKDKKKKKKKEGGKDLESV